MNSNTVQIGEHTLTVSMASLYRADKALLKAGLPTIMETFADVLEKLNIGEGGIDLSSVSGALRVVSFPAMVTMLSALMDMTEKKALEGPLTEGLPMDWMAGLFNALMSNVPQTGDVDSAPSSDEGGEGNLPAA